MHEIDKEVIEINGFHNTEEVKAIEILKNEFIPKDSKTHWLGKGSYFFNNLEIAIDNKNMLSNSENMVIISVDIEVPNIHYLDLDNKNNQSRFRIYCNEVCEALGKTGLEILYKPVKNTYNKIIFRCYCLDLYKTENNYYVITKTFPKDNPCYGIKVNNFEHFGFPYLETYICVSNNSCIKNKSIIEQEWFV